MHITRFAPSPTGNLHLGHAYSALFASDLAKRSQGTFIVRIEDIDPIRCKEEFVYNILEDLRWLNLSWPEPVRIQSQHMADYSKAFHALQNLGLVYPCFCTRRDVLEEAVRASQAPHMVASEALGEMFLGPLYPGTCRNLSEGEREARLKCNSANWRLDIKKARTLTGGLLWRDEAKGEVKAQPEEFGDIVLVRKDISTSYHLSVVVDDHLQGITLVTRGEDLFRVTDIHCLLQRLLGYRTPDYFHHKLLCDVNGRRFAKRDQALTLRTMREAGQSAEDVMALCSSLSRSM